MFATQRMHRLVAAGLLWLPVSAVAAGAEPASPPVCESVLFTSLGREVLGVAGQKKTTYDIAIPGAALVLAEIWEQDLDVRAEAVVDGAPTRSFDNPLRRMGPQRVLIDFKKAARLKLNVYGKDQTSGKADFNVYVVREEKSASPCLRALRLLSLADAHYDRGQAISFAREDATPGSAKEHYLTADRSYAGAAQLLGGTISRSLLAHAEFARASTLYLGLEDWAAAFAAGKTAVSTYKSLGDEYGWCRARAIAAAAQMEVARAEAGGGAESLANARRELVELAELHERRGERYDEAFALNNAGLLYSYDRMFDESLERYQRALDLYEQIGDSTRQAQVLQNTALVLNEMARPQEAIRSYEKALGLLKEFDNPKLYADTLNNLALSEYRLGRPDAALRHYSEALEILTRIQVPREQARSLQGIGSTYYFVGNQTEALAYFERALAMRSVALDPSGRITTLRSIATAKREAGAFREAIDLRKMASEIARDPAIKARVRTELARDYTASGALEQSGQELSEVFAIGFASDRIGQPRALLERARLSLAMGNYDSAERDASEALALFRKLELQSLAFEAVMIQARAACQLGNASRALRLADAAVTLSEDLRRTSANPSLRASLWQPLRTAFDLRIQLAADESPCGHPGKMDPDAALRLSEQSRNRTLAEFQARAAESGTGSTNASERRRNDLFAQIAAYRARLEVLADRDLPNEKAMDALRLQIAPLLRELDIVNAEAGVTPSGTSGDRALKAAIETIRSDTAVVEYWLGERGSFAWLIRRGKVRMVDLGSTKRIEDAARALHGAMRHFQSVPQKERVRRAREMFDLIIAPLPSDIRTARRIFFIPDGALHSVPFAALAFGKEESPEYLLQSRDIAIAASVISISEDEGRSGNAAFSTLMVADPVYSRADPRVTRSSDAPSKSPATANMSLAPTLRGSRDRPKDGTDWSRLIASGREASAIAAVLAPAPVELLDGFAANRKALLERDLAGYRILHFATHAVADMESPQLSTLVLSTVDKDGKRQVGDVFAGDLIYRRLGAELVVLSACDTAMGQARSGEGLLGLRYAAHAAGARTVVASLWPVVDNVGESLMVDFYKSMSREGLSPVAALSKAMRNAQKRWPDPALWSVFEISRVSRTQ